MSGQWHHSVNDRLEGLGNAVSDLWLALALPERARFLRRSVTLLLVVWVIFSVSKLIWTLLPDSDASVADARPIINPVASPRSPAAAQSVDIQAMAAWNLFGVIGEAGLVEIPVPVAKAEALREGIEDGARETRLDLKLRGAIASSEDGLGHAVIEYRSQQAVYSVGDELPVGNAVSLAKVILGGVVIDNNGIYEILRLFEETTLLEQLPATTFVQRKTAATASQNASLSAIGPAGEGAVAVAQNFRRQLYENPQSLAQVVRVSAVRDKQVLKGYRVDPGKDGTQFTQLGFKSGDVVTSINGIALDNPGNTLQLYQIMRSASEAVFELERAGANMTLTVNMAETSNGG